MTPEDRFRTATEDFAGAIAGPAGGKGWRVAITALSALLRWPWSLFRRD